MPGLARPVDWRLPTLPHTTHQDELLWMTLAFFNNVFVIRWFRIYGISLSEYRNNSIKNIQYNVKHVGIGNATCHKPGPDKHNTVIRHFEQPSSGPDSPRLDGPYLLKDDLAAAASFRGDCTLRSSA